MDHSSLFQKSDLKDIPYYYVGEAENETVVEMKQGYSSPLSKVLQRLALLGYTVNSARKTIEYLSGKFEYQLNDSKPFPFEDLCLALMKVAIIDRDTNYVKALESGQPFAKEAIPYLELEDLLDEDLLYGRYNIILERLHPYFLLCLLGENQANLNLPVNWLFADVAENWTGSDTFMNELPEESKFLIVTEGSSDGYIIKKALELLRPHLLDFFRFVDMRKNYPFTGTGNLYKFCQGLVTIRIQNKVLVVYDNDTEGRTTYNETVKLPIPPKNMRIIKLPYLKEFENFPTVDLNNRSTCENINDLAVAIECYLDLAWQTQKAHL